MTPSGLHPQGSDERTRAEWRALGFFYEFDDDARTWRIRASRAGIQKLVSALRSFGNDPLMSSMSEHEHLGPYGYMKLVTWTEPKIIEDGLYGRPADFLHLADLLASEASAAPVGERVRIDHAYSARNEADLVIIIEADGFDPASADAALPWDATS